MLKIPKIALVLALVLMSRAWAQSPEQPIVPSPNQIPADQQEKRTTGTETKTEFPSELTINVRGALDINTEKKNTDRDGETENWGKRLWNYLLDVKATDLLLALFTGIVALYTGLLWRNSKRTERAYVSGGGYFPSEDLSTGWKSEQFMLTINNYGKTPAYATHVEIGYWSLDYGPLPEDPPRGRRFDLGATVPPGKEGLPTDVRLHRSDIRGNVIYGRFFYEDIFARRFWGRKIRVRSCGFILQITPDRVVLPIDAPRAYTDWD
jgi:hypothetical protein